MSKAALFLIQVLGFLFGAGVVCYLVVSTFVSGYKFLPLMIETLSNFKMY